MHRYLLLLAVFLCVPSARAAIFVVGQGSPACTHATLQAAVNAAAANGPGYDTIAVTNQATMSPVTVANQSVWIVGGYNDCSRQTSGAKTRVEGNGARPFHISAFDGALQRHQVILQNLILSGADSRPANGGGVSLAGPDIDLFMVGVTITENVAQSGGGIHVAGGLQTKLTLSDTIIRDNAADYGGGISMEGGGTLRLVGSNEVSYNAAVNAGGGLAVDGGSRVVREGPFNLSHNQSGYLGGGAYIAGYSHLDYSQFMDQPLETIPDNVLRLEHNVAAFTGGGMWVGNRGSAMLKSPQMVSNEALDGGAIAAASGGGVSISGIGPPAVCRSNHARGRGSCVWAAYGGEVSMERAIISLNTSDSSGATIEVINEGRFWGGSLLLEHNDHPFRVGNTEPGWGGTYAYIRNATVADNSGTTFEILDKGTVVLVSSVVDNPGQSLSTRAADAVFDTECVVSANGAGLASIPSNVVASTQFVNRQQKNYRLRMVPENAAVDRCDWPHWPIRDLDGELFGHDLPDIDNLDGPFDAGAYEAYDKSLFEDGFE